MHVHTIVVPVHADIYHECMFSSLQLGLRSGQLGLHFEDSGHEVRLLQAPNALLYNTYRAHERISRLLVNHEAVNPPTIVLHDLAMA
jgi:hypothetical protein